MQAGNVDENIKELSLPECGQEVTHYNHKGNGLFDFSRLPWMVFLSILKFFKTNELCQFCLVDKLWLKACRDPTLWRDLDLEKYCAISDDDLIRLSSFSSNVVTLRICHCDMLTDPGTSCAIKQCSSLTECSITQCRTMSDDVLTTLGEFCHQLKKLDVTLSLNFTDEGIRKVCEGCPKLEELVIDQCSNLTNQSLVYLGRHSAMLKHISASSITNITDQGVGALLPGCQQLQTLRLPLCRLSGQSAYHIAQHGTGILYLDVRGAILEDDHLSEIVKSLKKLQTLNLGLCFKLTDESVKEIALHCKDIKHLFFVNGKITDEGLFHISVYCQDIVHLDVSWCHGVTTVGARKVLNCCPKLKHLGLFRCDNVPDSDVSEFGIHFPQVFISTLETEMKKSKCQK